MVLLLSKVSSLSTEKAAAFLGSPSYLQKVSSRPPVNPNSGDVHISMLNSKNKVCGEK